MIEVSNKNLKALKTTFEKVSVIRWTIRDFFDHVNNKTKGLDSEKFELNGLAIKFYLQLYLYSRDFNRLSYWLTVADMADEKPIEVGYKFWLENHKGEKCAETSVTTKTFTRNGDCNGFYEVLNHDQLLSKAAFFRNHPASVYCEITYQAVVDGSGTQNIDSTMLEGLWKSYQTGLLDSVTIRADEKEFKVAKMILSANSPVFEHMFLTPNCKETNTGIIELENTKAAVMEKLIEYMHRGKVDIWESIAIDLFKLSHKYDVKLLNILCAEAIGKFLSEEKLFEIVVMAYEYNSEKLKNAVSSFLLANREKGYFINLTTSKKWLDFMVENQKLANDILIGVYGKMGAKF